MIAERHRDQINKAKDGAKALRRHDWLWEALLLSISTMGGSRGAQQLIRNKDHHSKITFDALRKLSSKDRNRRLKETLRDAGIRWPKKKAKWLSENFERISKLSGPAAAKKSLLDLSGSEAKMEFLRSFAGVGPKYARNMLMDVYDPDFRESIAIDQRIKSVSKVLDLSFRNYGEHEQFYLDVAHKAGLQGWELDRLIYGFTNEFFDALQLRKGRRSTD